MTRRKIAAFLVAGALVMPGPALAVSVCVLGNAAVRISSESKRLLIDGLYREGYPEDVVLDAELRERIETARGEYDSLDLVLVTHAHKDHFNAAAVIRHLANNPAARLISTEEVIAAVASEIPVSRRRAIAPDERAVRLEAGGIDIAAFNLHHGASNETQNLGFMLELDGKRIIHLGDAMADGADFIAAGLEAQRVDVALVPFWYYLDEEEAQKLDGALEAEAAIPIHMPRPDADKDYLARFGGFEGLQQAIEKARPNTVQFGGGTGCIANVK